MMTIKNTLKVNTLLYIAIIYTLSILTLSLINIGKVEIIKIEASDKIYHTACYAIMSFLWCLYATNKYSTLKIKTFLIILVLITIFGIIIESMQLILTNYRSFDWLDAIANFVGCILGILVFNSLQKVFNL